MRFTEFCLCVLVSIITAVVCTTVPREPVEESVIKNDSVETTTSKYTIMYFNTSHAHSLQKVRTWNTDYFPHIPDDSLYIKYEDEEGKTCWVIPIGNSYLMVKSN